MNPLHTFLKTYRSTRNNNALKHIPNSIYDININSLQSQPVHLSQFKGKKLLFVNVASKCGFTPQYKELQELQDRYKDQLVVIGVPCNQFGNQESGSAKDIETFCDVNYGVSFLITEKIKVKGYEQHPLYTWLTKKAFNRKKNSSVKWNFQKYLVSEDGELIDYFYSLTKPLSSKITSYLT